MGRGHPGIRQPLRKCLSINNSVFQTVEDQFEELDTLRRTLLTRAGRLTRPQGKLTLTLNTNPIVQNALLRFLKA
jgi:hypothetical protein